MIRIAICDAFGRGVYGFLKKPLAYGKLEKKLDAVLSDFLETEAYVTCTNTGCKKSFGQPDFVHTGKWKIYEGLSDRGRGVCIFGSKHRQLEAGAESGQFFS